MTERHPTGVQGRRILAACLAVLGGPTGEPATNIPGAPNLRISGRLCYP